MYDVKERAKTCKSLCGILLIENTKRGVSTEFTINNNFIGPIPIPMQMSLKTMCISNDPFLI